MWVVGSVSQPLTKGIGMDESSKDKDFEDLLADGKLPSIKKSPKKPNNSKNYPANNLESKASKLLLESIIDKESYMSLSAKEKHRIVEEQITDLLIKGFSSTRIQNCFMSKLGIPRRTFTEILGKSHDNVIGFKGKTDEEKRNLFTDMLLDLYQEAKSYKQFNSCNNIMSNLIRMHVTESAAEDTKGASNIVYINKKIETAARKVAAKLEDKSGS